MKLKSYYNLLYNSTDSIKTGISEKITLASWNYSVSQLVFTKHIFSNPIAIMYIGNSLTTNYN